MVKVHHFSKMTNKAKLKTQKIFPHMPSLILINSTNIWTSVTWTIFYTFYNWRLM